MGAGTIATCPSCRSIERLVRWIRSDLHGRPVIEILAKDGDSGELVGRPAKCPPTIAGARRFGKRFTVDLSNCRSLLVHLMLYGETGHGSREDCLAANPVVALRLADDEYFWISHLAPRFIALVPTHEVAETEEVTQLGVDPLSRSFTPKRLAALAAEDGRALKTFLTHQATIAGIGNTYAAEILFEAKLAPTRKPRALSIEEVETLHGAVRLVLRRAIESPGAELLVYKKTGQPCLQCGATIAKAMLGQRTTY